MHVTAENEQTVIYYPNFLFVFVSLNFPQCNTMSETIEFRLKFHRKVVIYDA